MSHLKRQTIPTSWPIPRKGTKYIIKSGSKGMPLLVVLRDVLKLARTRKEVKRAINEKNILVCGKIVKNEKKNMELFDTLTIVSANKSYKLSLSEKRKYQLEEIKNTEKDSKISKIINKKVLKGKKIQLNLLDGRNYFGKIKCLVNDSVIIDLKKNQIEKCLPFKEKSKVIVIGGKHMGKKGIIQKIDNKLKIAEIGENNKKLNVLIKQLMVIE